MKACATKNILQHLSNYFKSNAIQNSIMMYKKFINSKLLNWPKSQILFLCKLFKITLVTPYQNILEISYNVKVGKNLKKLYGRGHVCGFSFRLDYAAKAKCIVRCTP